MQIFVCVGQHLLPVKRNRAAKPKLCLSAKAGTTKMLQSAARIMKITAILLLGGFLQVYAVGFGQRITLSETNAPIETVFASIEKQTNFKFLYAGHVIKEAKKVTIKISNAQIGEVLSLIFKDQTIDFEIKQKVIVIKPKSTIGGNNANKNEIIRLINLNGRVVNIQGEPVEGATIAVKGTDKSTITNSNGEFKLSGIEEDAIITISHVQYEIKSIIVNGKNIINAVLQTKISPLNEALVIAYGSTTKRFNTGNISSIKSKDIEHQPVNNVLLALQGRVPGLFITQNTGLPGGGITTRIQGQNSLRNGSDPLYVVDGVPILSQLPATRVDAPLGNGASGGQLNGGLYGSGNPLNYLNPTDIESIEVLKDADATAIFGSRAANGAILITTKRGKSGQTTISLDIQHGWGKVARKVKMMDTRQYLDMRYEALKNDSINLNNIAATNSNYSDLKVWDTTRYTDWQNELIGGTSNYNNINLTVSGGNSTIQYAIGGTWRKETTVFPADFNNQKKAFHFNINNASSNKKFNIQLTGNYLIDNNSLPFLDLTRSALLLEPVAPPLYTDEGNLNWQLNSVGSTTFNNPLQYKHYKYKNKTTNLISNITAGYKIIPSLEIKSSFGYTALQTNDFVGRPFTALSPTNIINGTPRSAQFGTRQYNNWIAEPQLRFNKKIFDGQLDILIGSTIQEENINGTSISAQGFNNDRVLEDVRAANTISIFNSIISNYRYNALFARFGYNWKDKVIINLSGRRDGSSRFGPKSQFHNFGSIGAAWLFGSEEWIRDNIPFISFGKIRGSYGTTASDQIGDYAYMNLYGIVGADVAYQGIVGLRPNGLPNPYLQWEETKKLQAGIDLGFVDNKLLLNLTYVLNRSSNQLLNYTLSTITGFGGVYQNFPATIENRSIELELLATPIRTSSFEWASNFNLTIPRNKVKNFPNIQNTSYGRGNLGVIIGEPIGIKKVYIFEGIDENTGDHLFLDGKGAITKRPDTAQAVTQSKLISTLPKFYGGFQNTITYKNLQLSFLFQFVKQIGWDMKFFNGDAFPGNRAPGFSNQPVWVSDRWTGSGQEATIAKYTTLATSNLYNAITSDHYYGDASYIRLRNLSLAYQIPYAWKRKALLKSCKVYIEGQNIFTITNYQGLDPETQSTTSLPPLRVLTVGIQIEL